MKIGTSREATRVWWNYFSNEIICIPFGDNHSTYVVNNHQQFNLPEFKNITVKDYDGPILKKAMDHGFIRINIDIRDPFSSTNVEGTHLYQLKKCVKWLINEIGEFKQLIIVQRHSDDDNDGSSFILNGTDDLNHFIKYGKLKTETFFKYGIC